MEYQRSISDVFQDIVANVQSIIRSEIRLAKTEVKEETSKASKAAAVLAAGAVLGLYALGFLLLTAARALEIVVAPWLADLIIAIVTAIAAYVVINMGRTHMKRVHAGANKTVQSVKENVEWARNQTK